MAISLWKDAGEETRLLSADCAGYVSDLKTTQRMLSVTQCGALHPLIKRDAAVIFAINHGYDSAKDL